MKRLSLTIPLLVALTAAALIAGFAAHSASAQSSTDSQKFYQACLAKTDGGVAAHKTCCELSGGTFNLNVDSNGQVVYYQCSWNSNASPIQQSFPQVASPTLAAPPTGANTSGASSGGNSSAGVYGWVTFIDYPSDIIP